MIINIIGGNGIMGSVHKPVFESAGHKVIISGRSSEISIEKASEKSDLTIISVPINAVSDVIKKIAPHCKAIMDFTSLKTFPVKDMLNYSDKECEVAGLHPLYGKVKSIEGKTIVYCKTEKSGKKCEEIVNCLKMAGAKIKQMTPEEHDKNVVSINQALRIKELTAYIKTMKEEGFSIKEMYEIAPPPTKEIIELCARQLNPDNDSMYAEIIKKDAFAENFEKKFLNNFKLIGDNYKKIASELREAFGTDFLKEMQEKAEKKIDNDT